MLCRRRYMCHGARRLLYHNRYMSCGWFVIPRGVRHSHSEKVTRSVHAYFIDDNVADLMRSSYSPTFDQVAGCYLTSVRRFLFILFSQHRWVHQCLAHTDAWLVNHTVLVEVVASAARWTTQPPKLYSSQLASSIIFTRRAECREYAWQEDLRDKGEGKGTVT